MAGDWIKMRVDLADDPAVIKIAGLLNVQEDLVVGKLHRLWAWAFTQTFDGSAPVSPAWIDRKVSLEGFAHAMAAAGWLRVDAESVQFPNFERHLSNSAKQRALDALRKASSRGSSSEHVRVLSGSQPDKSVTREEKRREEEEKQQQNNRDPGNAREAAPSPRTTPTGPAAAGAALAGKAERPDVMAALDAVPIGEPKRSELAANPLLTVAMIRHVANSGKGRGKRSGAIVLDLEAALRREAVRAEAQANRDRNPAPPLSVGSSTVSSMTGAAAQYVNQPPPAPVSVEERKRILAEGRASMEAAIQRAAAPPKITAPPTTPPPVEPTAHEIARADARREELRRRTGMVDIQDRRAV